MTETNKLPIMKAASYSWRFALSAWRAVLPAYLIYAVISGALFVIAYTPGTPTLGVVLMLLASIVFGVMCQALTLRLAIRGEFEGPMGLQFGGDERRLLGATLSFIFILGLTAIISGFIAYFLAVSYMSTTIPDIEAVAEDGEALKAAAIAAFSTSTGQIIAALLALVFVLPLLYIYARLITYAAATIDRGEVFLIKTWDWTKGHAFQIILAIIVSLSAFYILAQFGPYIFNQMIGMPASLPGQVLVGSPTQLFLAGLVAALLAIPLQLIGNGMSAFMYQGFKLQD